MKHNWYDNIIKNKVHVYTINLYEEGKKILPLILMHVTQYIFKIDDLLFVFLAYMSATERPVIS